MSPLRVPIMIPDKGVNPIDVLNDLPFLTAVMLAPLPRWQVIIFISSTGLFKISANRYVRYI